MKRNAILEKERIQVKAKRPLKELYRGVKLPVFRTLLGSLLYVVGTLVIATQADTIAAISIGDLKDLSPIFTYALMGAIGYVFFYISVVADLGFVELAARIRKKVWAKTMHLPLSYFDREGSNKVISRVSSDPEYSYQPFKLLQLTFTLLAFLLVVLTGDAAIPGAVLILIFGFVLTMVCMFIAARYSERGAQYVAAKLASLTAFLAERLDRIKFIKAMNGEERETENADRFVDERYEAARYNAMALTMVQFGQTVLRFILFAAAFLFGALMIGNGQIGSTASLAAFYAYGGNLILVFQFFAQFPAVFAMTKGGSKKIVSILEEEEEELDAGTTGLTADGDIQLENISFGYTDRGTLDNVSLRIPKGKRTAIVGPNGSGKTTVLRLIDRLYPAAAGTVRIGEAKDTDVSLRAWRDRFALVAQNAALFDGSIRDNICYGAKDVREEELQSVIRLACLEELIAAHEEGLDLRVGPNGEKLSGGEQQRVAIARAMLKAPDILIMDEATANLDSVTEKQIKDGITALTKGRTSIVVAHSYRAVENADYVVVMNGGRVEDQGTPAELLQRNGYFRTFAGAAAN
ncbi:MAG: ABC transporter ATP-binding protein [Oscillospiraceae bacterium]|nr:ABC transporter ATP-binding protein [Oscillospiraceae bacterium]